MGLPSLSMTVLQLPTVSRVGWWSRILTWGEITWHLKYSDRFWNLKYEKYVQKYRNMCRQVLLPTAPLYNLGKVHWNKNTSAQSSSWPPKNSSQRTAASSTFPWDSRGQTKSHSQESGTSSPCNKCQAAGLLVTLHGCRDRQGNIFRFVVQPTDWQHLVNWITGCNLTLIY